MGITCCFCSQKFCIKHTMPEMHGCGDAAKKVPRLPRVPCIAVGMQLRRSLRVPRVP